MKKLVAHPFFIDEAELGEGVIWDERIQRLWWVDITRGLLHRLNPETRVNETFVIGDIVSTVVPEENGEVVIAVRNGFARYDTDTGELQMLAVIQHDNPSIRFNDGKCDPRGRFWAGTLAEDGGVNAGNLYTLGHDSEVTHKMGNIGISNGIGWNREADTMYYIDSRSQQVVAYEYDRDTGAIAHPHTIVTIREAEGTPDGMCVDTEGMLWIALWNGGKVICINPENGERLAEVHIPGVTNVTSCTFGGEDMNILFISTARKGLTKNERKNQPLAGSIFAIKTDTTGPFAYTYKGGK